MDPDPPSPDPPALERSLQALEERVRVLEQSLAALQDTKQIEPRVAELPVAEERVRALEQSLAALQDTRQIEQRIAERVTAQLPQRPPIPVATVIDAVTNRPLPPAVKSLVNAAAHPSTIQQVTRSSWLAFDMVQELIAVGRMLLDPRYHTAWITRIFVIVFAVAIFLSYWWVPLSSVSVLGPILEKVADLVLACLLFVALFCETKRYKEWRAGSPAK
jgi:hypothetical protein